MTAPARACACYRPAHEHTRKTRRHHRRRRRRPHGGGGGRSIGRQGHHLRPHALAGPQVPAGGARRAQSHPFGAVRGVREALRRGGGATGAVPRSVSARSARALVRRAGRADVRWHQRARVSQELQGLAAAAAMAAPTGGAGRGSSPAPCVRWSRRTRTTRDRRPGRCAREPRRRRDGPRAGRRVLAAPRLGWIVGAGAAGEGRSTSRRCVLPTAGSKWRGRRSCARNSPARR